GTVLTREVVEPLAIAERDPVGVAFEASAAVHALTLRPRGLPGQVTSGRHSDAELLARLVLHGADEAVAESQTVGQPASHVVGEISLGVAGPSRRVRPRGPAGDAVLFGQQLVLEPLDLGRHRLVERLRMLTGVIHEPLERPGRV